MSDVPAPERLDEVRAALADGMRDLGLAVGPVAIERWLRLALLLERWGSRINLTGHRGVLAITRRLLLEAASLHRALPAAASIADLGSGAGVPGLPLALCRPEAQVLLVESRERRHYFQRAAIRELGLENARALRGRAETLEPILCEGVVSQAVAPSKRVLRWMLRWSAAGGWLAIATSPGLAGEAIDARSFEVTSARLVPYAAPDGPERAVWIARRPVDSDG